MRTTLRKEASQEASREASLRQEGSREPRERPAPGSRPRASETLLERGGPALRSRPFAGRPASRKPSGWARSPSRGIRGPDALRRGWAMGPDPPSVRVEGGLGPWPSPLRTTLYMPPCTPPGTLPARACSQGWSCCRAGVLRPRAGALGSVPRFSLGGAPFAGSGRRKCDDSYAAARSHARDPARTIG